MLSGSPGRGTSVGLPGPVDVGVAGGGDVGGDVRLREGVQVNLRQRLDGEAAAFPQAGPAGDGAGDDGGASLGGIGGHGVVAQRDLAAADIQPAAKPVATGADDDVAAATGDVAPVPAQRVSDTAAATLRGIG